MSRKEKAVWILVCVVLATAETRSLYRAAALQLQEQERLQNGLRVILENQRDQFATILENNQRQFTQTLLAAAGIKQLTEESINNITGGDSFCRVGDMVFKTNAAPGSQLYLCDSVNHWALLSGGDSAMIPMGGSK